MEMGGGHKDACAVFVGVGMGGAPDAVVGGEERGGGREVGGRELRGGEGRDGYFGGGGGGGGGGSWEGSGGWGHGAVSVEVGERA